MSWFNIWSAWCLHMALWSLKPYVVLALVTFNEASWFPCSPLSQNGLGESTHNCFHSVSKNFVKLKMVIVVHTYICLHYMCIYTVYVLCLYMSLYMMVTVSYIMWDYSVKYMKNKIKEQTSSGAERKEIPACKWYPQSP